MGSLYLYYSDTLTPASVDPPPGYKWKLVSVSISLTTSSTVGSRSVYVKLVRINFPGWMDLLNCATSTVSSVETAFLDSAYTSNNTGASANIVSLENDFWIYGGDNITLVASLQTGDTWNATLIVEEILDV